MPRRVDKLADELERVNAEVVAFTEGLTDAAWTTYVPNEQRSVGVLIQHIAFGYAAETDLVRAILTGEAVPDIYASRAALDAFNARHAQELQAGARADAVRALREEADATCRFLRALDDADLDRSRPIGLWNDADISVGFLIERIVLGHPITHLNSIRAALSQDNV
jgi:hypothetical protein